MTVKQKLTQGKKRKGVCLKLRDERMLVALFRKNKGGSEVIGFSLIATSLYGS